MSDIYLSLTETPTVVTLSQPVVSGVLSSNVTVTNVVSVNVVTMPAITVQAAAPAVTTVAGTVAVSNFPASSSVTIANFPTVTTVAGTVALDSASLIALENVTVTVGAAVTIAGFSTSSLPPSTVTVGNSVTIGNFPSTQTIAGTVTANLVGWSGDNFENLRIGGHSVGAGDATRLALEVIGVDGNPLPISGTVTANSIFPRVTLIDGSGTVTTANTAITVFASSSTRSYLLVQVTTGSAFVNVGATATTVNGINLTAGQGYSWETTIPQGIVSLISTTTSSRYVAKEA